MDACCETKAEEINALRGKHKNVLKAVLAINATLFIVESLLEWLRTVVVRGAMKYG